jgi:hypothetical protein
MSGKLLLDKDVNGFVDMSACFAILTFEREDHLKSPH